jgi:hypothetical protein
LIEGGFARTALSSSTDPDWVKASVEGCFWSPQLNQGFAGFQVL